MSCLLRAASDALSVQDESWGKQNALMDVIRMQSLVGDLDGARATFSFSRDSERTIQENERLKSAGFIAAALAVQDGYVSERVKSFMKREIPFRDQNDHSLPIGDITAPFEAYRYLAYRLAGSGHVDAARALADQYNWLDTDDYVVGLVEAGSYAAAEKILSASDISLALAVRIAEASGDKSFAAEIVSRAASDSEEHEFCRAHSKLVRIGMKEFRDYSDFGKRCGEEAVFNLANWYDTDPNGALDFMDEFRDHLPSMAPRIEKGAIETGHVKALREIQEHLAIGFVLPTHEAMAIYLEDRVLSERLLRFMSDRFEEPGFVLQALSGLAFREADIR